MLDTSRLILEQIATVPGCALKIKQLAGRKANVAFEQVTKSAQGCLLSTIFSEIRKKNRSVWVVCETERAQEQLGADLAIWLPEAFIFPHLEISAIEGAIPDPEVNSERLAALQKLAEDTPALVVITRGAFDERIPSPQAIRQIMVEIAVGSQVERDDLIQRLAASGYEGVAQVTERGQFAVRGGLMDVYSWQQTFPIRIEWFDDVIESIREFQIDEQTSIRALNRCVLLLGEPELTDHCLRQYRKKADVTIGLEFIDEDCQGAIYSGGKETEKIAENYDLAFFAGPGSERNRSSDSSVREAFEAQSNVQISQWAAEGYDLVFLHKKPSEIDAAKKKIGGLPNASGRVSFLMGNGGNGFVFPAGKLVVLPISQLLGQPDFARPRQTFDGRTRRGLGKSHSQIDFTELTEGDLVVHLEYGLARFDGVQTRLVQPAQSAEEDAILEERMVLGFADDAKLFVPLEQSFLVSRYVGMGKRGVNLSHLGDGKWSSTKAAAEKSIYDYASKLLKVQATRELQPGIVFEPDGVWQKEFEEVFPYRETADQIKAIRETKADMEAGRTMDRLICGDVGFGKTEIAIRAAFKAATGGKQVAMMVPTTVLAQQHYENFSARMANFPVVVELLSRYRSHAEQDRVAHGLTDGSVDIVIGTHRLISPDVSFKELGLLIVDEEQRFGVKHKERIKERFPNVDVLTLSATPIPRTLYLALTGARDLSTLETPPPNRYPVETVICGYDERIIRTAIDRELDRQGQIYFLHNRVETIEKIAARIRHLCPKARVDIGHGQMEQGQLEEVMHRFVKGETDVLVATTIIESGLDIPNANTIIIDRADRFGLADLYQLRGRVGRGNHKAYAYLMLPRDLMTVGEARKRINAIKQYSALGAGFKIALRDLEIRGAGNILGIAQSGHLTAIGFDLYCQLLRQAVAKMRGEKVRPRLEVVTHLDFVANSEGEFVRAEMSAIEASKEESASPDLLSAKLWPAFIPTAYIEEPRLRIQAYRQLSAVARNDDLDQLKETWRDRFGRFPEPVENLLTVTQLKLLAASKKIQQIEVRGAKVMLTRNADFVLANGKFPRLTSEAPVSKMRQIFALLESL